MGDFIHYKLSNADLAKIHAEVNQLNNQRFLASGAAAALLAALSTRLFPVSELWPITKEKMGILVSASGTSFIYSVVLIAIAFQSLRLRRFMRTYTTYLIAKHASEWERDWEAFLNHRGQKRVSYIHDRAHTIIIQMCSFANLIADVFLLYLCWDLIEIGENKYGVIVLLFLSPILAFLLIVAFEIARRKVIGKDDDLKAEWVEFLGKAPPADQPEASHSAT